jgi:LytS/YehU family sensor histidine kinase
MDNPSNSMNSKQLAIISILVALSIGTNYAMFSLYNVKLMDFIVFVGGFCFGPFVGVFIGVVSWMVYGTLNPLGFSLPIWLSTMFSEPIYGIVGALVRRSLSRNDFGKYKKERADACLFFGVLGMSLAVVYDVITNIVFGYVSGWNVVFALIVGFVPFGFVHMMSNAFFFGFGCVPAINAIMKVVGGETSDVAEE